MAPTRRRYRKLQIKPDAYRVGETAPKERERQLGGLVERPLAYAKDGQIVHRRQEAKIECTLDAYYYRSMITDQQRQAGIMFRNAYLSAARGVKVSDPLSGPSDGATAADRIDRTTQARKRLLEAREALTDSQWAVIEAVAGWDTLAGNSRRLDHMRAGLDVLGATWL